MSAMLPQFGQISQFFFKGNLDCDKLDSVIEPLQKANLDIQPLLQQCVEKFLMKKLRSADDSKLSALLRNSQKKANESATGENGAKD